MLSAFLALIDSEADKHKFEQIYEKYKDMVYNIAYRRLNDYHLSQEVVQDTFLYVAKTIGKYSDNINSEGTARLIAVIANRSAIRKYNGERKENIEHIESVEEIVGFNCDAHSDDYILDKIQNLDEKYSSVIILKCKYGFTVKEISDMLQLPQSIIKNRLHKGRLLLKESLIATNDL